MSRFSEIPASPVRGPEVVRHMSKKQSGCGLLITQQGTKFGVWNVARVCGNLTARMFAVCDSETEAREVANRTWLEMGL